jgi:hypothetical protein
MTKATKTKRSAKVKASAPDAKAALPKRRRQGGGRRPGQLNQKTIVMREAIGSVYAQLQEKHGEGLPNGHFLKWAEANPTEFYRHAIRTLPLQIETNAPAIGVIVFRGIND